MNNLFTELKRRNVFKVATAYAIAGWLVIQVVTVIEEPLGIPDWFDTMIIVLVGIGFPIALVIAWAFELTPDGLKKTDEVEVVDSVTQTTGKKINGIIITVLALTVIFLVTERLFFATSIQELDVPIQQNVSNKSIAVLPFDDFNAGGQQEYFADGLTEEILNSLAKTPDLLVASRTSSFQYKDKNIDIVNIADTLGVAHILEGSVRESTDKYRITAQLIRASDGFHLWSETYDREKTDIIDVQEEIAFQIATALETAMDPEALKDMINVGTSSIEAYTLYLEGLSKTQDFNTYDPREAFNQFEQARSIDPEFAAAHYQAAMILLNDMSLTSMYTSTFGEGYNEKVRMIDERLSIAIQFANQTDRLLYMSKQAFLNMELRKSIDFLAQYIEERPSEVANYSDIVYYLALLGEYEIAREYHTKGQEFILSNKLSSEISIAFYFWTNNMQNADPWMQQQLDRFPYSENLAYQSHRIMLWNGEYDRAREVKRRLKGLEIPIENFAVSDLRQACADGDDQLAQQVFEEKIENTDIGAVWISLKTLGRDDEAIELIKEMDERGEMIYLVAWLYYRYFDYTQYPNLKAMLETENHIRGPIEEIPFRCGRNS